MTFTGKECVCSRCLDIPVVASSTPIDGMPSSHFSPSENPMTSAAANHPSATTDCAGCGDEIQEGQALIALERQWHIWCFKCASCGDVLHGEYMGKDDAPYCERDYQRLFGVKCAHCERSVVCW